VPFTGRARDVLLGFKYRNRRQVARHLAGLVVNAVVAGGDLGVDVVTWAPTSAARRRERGFDQGELIARCVGRQLGVPVQRLLERSGPAHTQTGRSRADRLHGVAFRARPGLAGRRVLVVDDVVTTGATLRSARTALRAAGAGDVVLYAVAATPIGLVAAGRDRDRRAAAPSAA
jgi:ComF family protein